MVGIQCQGMTYYSTIKCQAITDDKVFYVKVLHYNQLALIYTTNKYGMLRYYSLVY